MVNGRMVTSFWDTCSSHNLISGRLAAELIAEGAEYSRDVYIPMKQGVLWTGIIKSKLKSKVSIVHQGRVVEKETEIYVWDMGADITLSNAYLEDNGLLPATAAPEDDSTLAQRFNSVQTGWGHTPHKEKGSEVHGIANHIQAQVFEEAIKRVNEEKLSGSGQGAEEAEGAYKKEKGGCTLASKDS